jgi:carboxymethylenebutenolidase
MKRADEATVLADLGVCMEYLRDPARGNGKVAILGYCFGGLFAYYGTTRLGADAGVAFHPTGIQDHLDEALRVRAPLSIHIGDDDPWVPLDAIRAIKGALEGFAHVMVYRYPAMKHGFTQAGGASYDRASAELAESRAFDMLDGTLRNPAAA